ncbi:hypothetical protein [Alkalihalophilus marmarensis]|uniref:hypothetical protein n=1 Tax=Alkalihalophilus marmarensis TaxID=521377 RepID=UPI002E1D20FB|nr:hypothetical protein [Alkalihalophilus marmarensis]
MTKERQGFKSSVNIKFDLGKSEFYSRYLPTPSHAESLIGILNGLNDDSSRRSHIIIGAYGTGKSLLGTLIGGMASHTIEEESFEVLKHKFDNVDDEVYDQINKFQQSNKKYIPVVLNGNEGRFRNAVISSIMSALEKNGVDIVVPGVVNEILYTVELWEKEFPKTYKNFKVLLKNSDRNIDIWRINILNHDKEEIEWFSSIFPQLTSGAQFVVTYKEGFVEQIKYVLDELDKLNLGMFIIHDEFGRFLQNIEANQIHETMQDLQDLAELADHYNSKLNVLLITHKNLRQYFLRFNQEYQNEFQRIEKRFRLYHIESDRATFIRLTESVLKENLRKRKIDNDIAVSLSKSLRKFTLFNDLNDVEVEKLVIKGAHPIHPVTLFTLPFLSNLFAQNERTLFTFLESEDTGGLMNHINSNKDHYLLPKLFNYFFPNLDDLDGNDANLESVKTYKRIITKVPADTLGTKAEDLLKLITIWTMCSLQSKQQLTTEFISFTLNQDIEETKTVINHLVALKAIRYNTILGYWELFEGSSINIDDAIKERTSVTTVNKSKKIEILEKSVQKKFYLANDYNDSKSMTRFAAINILFSTDILKEDFNTKHLLELKNSDAVINYVIIESLQDYEPVKEKIKLISDEQALFAISNLSFEKIEPEILSFQILNNLLSDEEFINEDRSVKEELKLRIDDTMYAISKYMNVFTEFNSDLVWIINGAEASIGNEIILEKRLSDIMFALFPYTPEIRNDSYNRRKINNVQRKAGYLVVDNIIHNYDKPGLSIEGNGPDYLIYATIFKNNELDLTSLNSISNEFFSKLREELLSHIENNQAGNLHDLITIMSDKPYGIRRPIIPILLVSLLRDKWDQIMFYRNNMFVPGLNGEKLFNMLEESREYEYVFYDFDEKYTQFFDKLKELFLPYIQDQVKESATPIALSSGVLSWLRALPRFTQISNNMQQELRDLKNIIKRSEIDPQDSIEQLYKMYEEDLSLINKHKNQLENFLDEKVQELEKTILSTANVTNYTELKNWAHQHTSLVKKQNKLVKSIIRSESDNWIDIVTNGMVGVALNEWSDTTHNMFEQMINNELIAIDQSKPKENEITISIDGKEKSISKIKLSTKSETIYKNVQRMIKNAGRSVPQEEVEALVLNLIEEFVE